MAQVTVELGQLLMTDFELFDFHYDFDDKEMAKKLEEAVIEYYWDYEIGRETPDAFKRMFKYRWKRAMEYYNKLYNTTLLEYNPLINYKMSEALEELRQTNREQQVTGSGSEDIDSSTSENTVDVGTNTNTRTDNTQTQVNSSDTMSDYPQQDIGTGDYLSGQQLSDSTTHNTGTVTDQGSTDNTRESENTGTSTTTRKDEQETTDHMTDKNNYQKTIEGLTGRTYQELIQLERDNILRITGMVIEELKPCFILVY